ncbi:hypothetical protein B0H14DRAFT_2802889 [Mycena olivaceomarginata]|nr:hypothetical protein B0H14DRAFT_2802889 [Mycena olivaceomarginata]
MPRRTSTCLSARTAPPCGRSRARGVFVASPHAHHEPTSCARATGCERGQRARGVGLDWPGGKFAEGRRNCGVSMRASGRRKCAIRSSTLALLDPRSAQLLAHTYAPTSRDPLRLLACASVRLRHPFATWFVPTRDLIGTPRWRHRGPDTDGRRERHGREREHDRYALPRPNCRQTRAAQTRSSPLPSRAFLSLSFGGLVAMTWRWSP